MKKFVIYVIVTAILIGIVAIWQYNNDKKIIQQAKEIKKNEVEKLKLKLEILDQKNIVKLADAKVEKAEEKQRLAKLSFVDAGKIMDGEITKISKLREVGADSLTVSIGQWQEALVEIEKYKQSAIENDIKWSSVAEELKLKIIELETLDKLKDEYIAKLEKIDLEKNVLIIRLTKKADRIINFPTANINVITLPGGGNYFSVGIGGSINLKRLIFGKLNIPKLLLGG